MIGDRNIYANSMTDGFMRIIVDLCFWVSFCFNFFFQILEFFFDVSVLNDAQPDLHEPITFCFGFYDFKTATDFCNF